MKHIRKLLILTALVLCLAALLTAGASAAPNGWQQEEGEWYYYQNGARVQDWKKIGGYWYYFNPCEDGAMATGRAMTYTYDEGTGSYAEAGYYLFGESSGRMQANAWYGEAGWSWSADSAQKEYWYYGADGREASGWKKIGGYWYYFSPIGIGTDYIITASFNCMLHSTNADGSPEAIYVAESYGNYLFAASGRMLTNAWLETENVWSYSLEAYVSAWNYYGSNGAEASGWKQIGGYWYYFDPYAYMEYDSGNNYMLADWRDINTNYDLWADDYALEHKPVERYYFATSGKMQTNKWTSEYIYPLLSWYYYGANGKEASGWTKIGSGWYYFLPDSANRMAYGAERIANAKGVLSTYFFGNDHDDGVMKTGWQQVVGDEWWYFDTSGKGHNGWLQYNNRWYCFVDGEPFEGWCTVDGVEYYFDGGRMASGSQYIDGVRWYFNSSGTRYDGWKKLDGAWYWFVNGRCCRDGWENIPDKNGNDVYYWFDEAGVMAADGWYVIEGEQYYFDANGRWVPGKTA